MRFCLNALFIIIALPFVARAQQFHGRVYELPSGLPVGQVLVTNTRTGSLWLGDSLGNVAFTAFPGDVVSFQHHGHRDYSLRIAGYTDRISIAMERAPIELKEVVILSPMARFKQDSIFNHQFFHKQLSYAHSQVALGTSGIGVGAEGLVSQLALITSGKRKRARRLEEEMNYLEGMQFNGIRYTSSLVSAQTGLDDSAAFAFILRNPIPNDFLRIASELELKMRIRELYRAEALAVGKKEKRSEKNTAADASKIH